MKRHSLTEDDLRSLGPYYLAFQVEVAEKANARLGIETKPTGIDNPAGGVMAGGREIAIFRDYVERTHAADGRSTKQEIAVAEAINEVNQRFREQGAQALPNRRVAAGEHLRRMFCLG